MTPLLPFRAGPVPGHGALVAGTAANLAGWHDASIRALGLRTAWRDGWWLTPDDAPGIYFRAIAVRPGADPSVPMRGVRHGPWLAMCDPWGDVDLAPEGLSVEAHRPWMARPAGPVPDGSTPAGLAIDRVRDAAGLLDVERTAAIGFEAPLPEVYAWHGPGLLLDARCAFWLGRRDGQPVSTANAFTDAGVVGIYSVATIPGARRRGYATAVTRQALSVDPSLPAVLQPSETAEPIYRRLGFERFTMFRTWTRRQP